MPIRFDLTQYSNPVFLETGTGAGDGIQAALEAGFPKVVSIELNGERCRMARARFADWIRDRRVLVVQGDSQNCLAAVMNAEVARRATIWLDAHAMTGKRLDREQGMLLRELSLIAQHEVRDHTILVDDRRLFPRWGISDAQITKCLHAINPQYRVSYLQGLIEDDVLLAHVPEGTGVASQSGEIPKRWHELDAAIQQEFRLGGQMRLLEWYFDDRYDGARWFRKAQVNRLVEKARQRETSHLPYRSTSTWLYEALDDYCLSGKRVVIVGSRQAGYEAMCLAYGGQPTTVDYNGLATDHPELRVMGVEEFLAARDRFDVCVSISSIEHAGLGRYGEPLAPNGDLETMQQLKSVLVKNGLLLLAVPVGQDTLCWNAHRIYGRTRLPMLFSGWTLLGSYGFDPRQLEVNESGKAVRGGRRKQPVFVLKNA